jgi:hypothetical protein
MAGVSLLGHVVDSGGVQLNIVHIDVQFLHLD